MKRRSASTGLLAIAVATGLFLIANHFDNRKLWQPAPQELASMNADKESRTDSPVDAHDPATCDAAEEQMRDAVAAAQYCSEDEDCTLFDYGYPIQCMTSVAMDHVTALRLQYREYEASCRFRVYYDCPTEDAKRIAVCRDHHCAVELETVDMLREETMHHLGLDQ